MSLVLFGLGPSFANHIVGATGLTGCDPNSPLNIHQPTDPNIGYEKDSLTSPASNALEWVMVNKVLPTDLEVGGVSSGGDFVYHDASYSTWCNKTWWTPTQDGVRGTTICSALVSNACDTHDVYLSTGYMNSTTTGNVRKLLCHETGHAIGITHNEHTTSALDSCMKTPSNSAGIAGYSPSHEVAEMINFVW